VTEPPSAPEKSEDADAHRKLLFQARVRGLLAVGGTLVFAFVAFASLRWCAGELPGDDACKTPSDCEGVLGVECLHAPTSTYCTHSCNRNEDCANGFHCESPPWEKGTTRLLCLKNIAPPTK
jgi:hypothetical protein